MAFTHQCGHCNSVFESDRKTSKYCQHPCAVAARTAARQAKKKTVTKVCPWCSDEFSVPQTMMGMRKAYCSRKCASAAVAAKRKLEPLRTPCKVCNEIFEHPRTSPNRVVCGEACKNELKRQQHAEKRAQKVAVMAPCAHCGTDFEVIPTRKKYCSKACANQAICVDKKSLATQTKTCKCILCDCQVTVTKYHKNSVVLCSEHEQMRRRKKYRKRVLRDMLTHFEQLPDGSYGKFLEFECSPPYSGYMAVAIKANNSNTSMSLLTIVLAHQSRNPDRAILLDYSQFLLETKLGRRLSPEESVGFVDGDWKNFNVQNLRVECHL